MLKTFLRQFGPLTKYKESCNCFFPRIYTLLMHELIHKCVHMIVSVISGIQPGRLDTKIAAEHPEHRQLNSLAPVRAEVKSVRI